MTSRANGLVTSSIAGDVSGSNEVLSFSVSTQAQKQVAPPTGNLSSRSSAQLPSTNAPIAAAANTAPEAEAPVQLVESDTTTTRALSATTPQNASGASPASTVTPTPAPADCVPQGPLFCVYTVKEGDTLSTIAKRLNIQGNTDVTASELIAQSNKPDVASADDLSIGQKLRIPLESGVIHTVLYSQTLSDIATQYGVSSADILAVAPNGIGDADSLRVGQEVLVPNPKQFRAPAPAPTATPKPSLQASAGSSSSTTTTSAAAVAATPSAAGTKPPAVTGAVSSSGLIWPASGPISSYFGPSHPLGIDIDFFANPNQPVHAAAAGTVTFAGGDPCCSYGYYVIVDHGNGMQTLYAHLSSISVSVGQKVAQGETLGLGGRTGYATGNHLHFEVHVNGAVVNPLSYLP